MRYKNKTKIRKQKLAFYGGTKVRNRPMPARAAFGRPELEAVKEVFDYYRGIKKDFGYQDRFEKLYTDAFVRYMGGEGFADALCTGTAALYVALAALELKPGSQVLVSAITDPGTINAIILNRLTPLLVDTLPGSCNIGLKEVKARITDKTKAIVVVHLAGKRAPVDQISAFAKKRKLAVVEDCSQAHGARISGKKVGTFGDIAVLSTMYRKSHATAGCGGVIFTRYKRLYDLIRAYADRGKPFFKEDFDEKDPNSFLFPALNLNIDELSCAIGLRSLAKLETTRRRRVRFLKQLGAMLRKYSRVCRMSGVSADDSPFFQPIFVDSAKISCSKLEFARAVKAEGIDINPDYRYVVGEWEWVQPYLADRFQCKNAVSWRERSFNILFNENYGKRELKDIVNAVLKVEKAYLL